MSISHVFVLMLENRSFDHLCGLSGTTGIDPRTGQDTAIDGLPGAPAGALPNPLPTAPFSLEFDPGHEFTDVVTQLCGPGAQFLKGQPYPPIDNSGFLADAQAKLAGSTIQVDPSVVFGAFTPEQLPVLNALAHEFAICDRWFSSVPGPTWPNRLFVHAATSGGLDASPNALQSTTAMFTGYQFEHGTIFDRFSPQQSWYIVESDALPQSLSLGGMVAHAVEGRFLDIDDFVQRVQDPAFAAAYTFIEPHYGHVLADGRNFKCGSSMHPLDDVTRGEALVKRVYEAVRRSPHWPESLLIITFDEHGGFYDHVAPPRATPPGDLSIPGLNHFGFAFDQLGVRVPALVISPLMERGIIDHTTYDHSSIPALLEHLFNLEPLTERDKQAETVEHLLTRSDPRECLATLPDPAASGLPDCADGATTQLAADLETLPGHLVGDYEPALAGFLQVAIAREIHIAAAADGDIDRAIAQEKARLQQMLGSVQNKFDAVRLLRQVEVNYQQWRQAISSSGS